MDGLVGITSVTSLNGVDGLGVLFQGGQAEVNLEGKLVGKEAAVAVARLLLRSEQTLTKLDLRCFKWNMNKCIHALIHLFAQPPRERPQADCAHGTRAPAFPVTVGV